MEYAKRLLKAHGVDLGEISAYTDVFDSLSNQQELKKITKKLLATLNLEGNASIVEWRTGNRFRIAGNIGDVATIESHLSRQSFLATICEQKKMYVFENAKEKEEGFYMVFPIISKEETVGLFIIHDPQEDITCWKEIYALVFAMSFVFKYYNLIETTKRITTIDVLTGLFNSRHFQYQINLEIQKSKRNLVPLSMVMFEIIDFNEINQKLGFDGGEEVIRQVGRLLKRHSRGSDMPSKLYDDKFGVLLYDTNEEGAIGFTQRFDDILSIVPVEIGQHRFNVQLNYSVVEYEKTMSKESFYEKAKSLLANGL